MVTKLAGEQQVVVLDSNCEITSPSTSDMLPMIEKALEEVGGYENNSIARQRIYTDLGNTGGLMHWHNSMAGVVRHLDTLAVRIDSAHTIRDEGRQKLLEISPV